MSRQPMTSRARLTAALRREPVDRLPWTIDLDYYNSALRDRGAFEPRFEGVDGFLRQHEELGADPYYCYPVFRPFETVYDGVAVETRIAGRESVTTYALGSRSLVSRRRYMPESFCWAPAQHAVRDREDLELLLDVLRRARVRVDLGPHRRMQAEWGDRGLVAIGVPRTPVPALLVEWCGLEAAAFLAVDAPDRFADAAAELDRIADPVYDALARYRPVVVHFSDNISGENVGSFWESFMHPVYRRRVAALREAGIVCAIHNDGTVRQVLGRIARVGFDAAEALTPAPVGDVAAGDLRGLAGRDDFVLWGMVPGAAFAPHWTEDCFRRHVLDVLASCTPPLILGTADQIPPDGDLGRVRLVADILASRPA